MSVVKERADTPFVTLMARVWRRIKIELEADARELAPDLRPSQVRILSLTPAGGMRVGDLAALANMTAQSLGEFVETLCQAGYMQVVADPSDRRARLVCPTERGAEIGRAMTSRIRDLEERWAHNLGKHNWEELRALLIELNSAAG
jgi:DNA-binding MarR family transcriptional regulator